MSRQRGRELEESPEREEEPAASNSFANDGSFLAQFRKSMENEEKTKQQEEQVNDDEQEATKSKDEEKEREAERFIAGYMGQMKGKRKALMKTKPRPAKKKKEEEETDHSDKSSAWKAYMAEVEKYKAMSCSDDTPHKRPLVK